MTWCNVIYHLQFCYILTPNESKAGGGSAFCKTDNYDYVDYVNHHFPCGTHNLHFGEYIILYREFPSFFGHRFWHVDQRVPEGTTAFGGHLQPGTLHCTGIPWVDPFHCCAPGTSPRCRSRCRTSAESPVENGTVNTSRPMILRVGLLNNWPGLRDQFFRRIFTHLPWGQRAQCKTG